MLQDGLEEIDVFDVEVAVGQDEVVLTHGGLLGDAGSSLSCLTNGTRGVGRCQHDCESSHNWSSSVRARRAASLQRSRSNRASRSPSSFKRRPALWASRSATSARPSGPRVGETPASSAEEAAAAVDSSAARSLSNACSSSSSASSVDSTDWRRKSSSRSRCPFALSRCSAAERQRGQRRATHQLRTRDPETGPPDHGCICVPHRQRQRRSHCRRQTRTSTTPFLRSAPRPRDQDRHK